MPLAPTTTNAHSLSRLSPDPSTIEFARFAATVGWSQPRIGDQRRRSGQPVMPFGSKTQTLPFLARDAYVLVKASARVEVTMTGPGASMVNGVQKCTSLPCRGGAR